MKPPQQREECQQKIEGEVTKNTRTKKHCTLHARRRREQKAKPENWQMAADGYGILRRLAHETPQVTCCVLRANNLVRRHPQVVVDRVNSMSAARYVMALDAGRPVIRGPAATVPDIKKDTLLFCLCSPHEIDKKGEIFFSLKKRDISALPRVSHHCGYRILLLLQRSASIRYFALP